MAFAIAGVTGNTGKVVAETLLAEGKKVRVIVRDASKGAPWKEKGAEVAVADLADAAALEKALAGVEGAYLLVPPTMTAPSFAAYQDAVTASVAKAVEGARVPHVVFLSSIGAQHDSGTGPIAGLHRAETRLSTLAGTRFSFVRAAYFVENVGASLGALAGGVLPSFLPAALEQPMIATRDIGRVAASLLVEGAPAKNQVIELGTRASMNDVAEAIGRVTGKRPEVQEAPLDAVVPTFTGFGMPADLAALYQEMLGGIVSGRVAFEGTHRRVEAKLSLDDTLRTLLG